MTQSIIQNTKDRMEKAIASLKKELASIRAGRANPAILDRVQVDYYGTATPLNQMANISTLDARTLLIQPWDKTVLNEIEKAILKSDLGLTPANDGTVIRISIPPLTEERRKELVKLAKKTGEESKVAIRNIRRDANDELKKLEKAGDISEDEARRTQDEIQKTTDKYIDEVDKLVSTKEKEILEV
ncbi:ribosome recycling factor [Vulcanibacillus modesticaldus]|uniref:Ribosome-recycling factor n=1 Tax=Vulcanibacillus modesticaldus TaxID=337097 RepID=A0A1D2YXM9_9BACI|nr:ribosome recycling factor [Vulcanibacillus modesticaldus]OEG00433.1 ribosome recycling factor [Vulcanibacillus modesticaldus]